MQLGGYNILSKPNDGMVSLYSVESLDYSNSLGQSNNCHANLINEYEYSLAKVVLQENR
jgi:hypothetical protein